jgi:hypothetical protein
MGRDGVKARSRAPGHKARAIVNDLRASKMGKAVDLVEQAVHETLSSLCLSRHSLAQDPKQQSAAVDDRDLAKDARRRPMSRRTVPRKRLEDERLD